jgi:hypothetical protein
MRLVKYGGFRQCKKERKRIISGSTFGFPVFAEVWRIKVE